jgi:hypothetical protein
VNWEILARKEYKPPYVPIISSNVDVSNFDREFTECAINSYSEMNTPISHPDRVYIDFTYNEENKLAAGSAKMEMDENA